MFGIGSGEMLVFAVVVLIALGPKRLPDFMRTVGKGLREIRKATTDLRKHSGIDELMRDDPAGLRALGRDISRDPAPRREQKLSAHDLAKESPVEGVDIAHAHYLAKKNAAAAAKEAAVARNAQQDDKDEKERVSVGATFAIEAKPGSAVADAPAGFEGDTVPDKAAVSPKVRHEPTMLGIPAADPYALPAAKPAPKASAPPPPPPPRSAAPKSTRSAPPPRPSSRPSAPPSPSARPSARPSAPPPVPAALRSAPPPPPAIGPSSVLDGKRASLPPSPSLTPSVPPPADKPNARESTMAIEVEDLTLDDET